MALPLIASDEIKSVMLQCPAPVTPPKAALQRSTDKGPKPLSGRSAPQAPYNLPLQHERWPSGAKPRFSLG